MMRIIRGLILALVVLFMLGFFVRMLIDDTQDVGEEAYCTAAVYARDEATINAQLGIDLGDIKLFPIDQVCYTFERELPLEIGIRDDMDAKEKMMKSVGELVVNTWRMFGQGQYKDSLKDLFSKTGDKPCHIAYAFNIDSSEFEDTDYCKDENGDKIDGCLFEGIDLVRYLENQVYEVDKNKLEAHDNLCIKGEDPDGDDRIAEEDSDCNCGNGRCRPNGQYDTPCEAMGGSCDEFCGNNDRQIDLLEWDCNSNSKKCCVPWSASNTYYEFVQKGDGLILIAQAQIDDYFSNIDFNDFDSDEDLSTFIETQYAADTVSYEGNYIKFRDDELYGVAIVQPILKEDQKFRNAAIIASATGAAFLSILIPPVGLPLAIGIAAGAGGAAAIGTSIEGSIGMRNIDLRNYHVYVDRYDRMSTYCSESSSSRRK
jgi:hypothetical protein